MASVRESGRTLPRPFAYFAPDSSSWRMSRLSVAGDLPQSRETWPRSGMTCAGAAYELPQSVPHTSETAGSESPPRLFPTPKRSDGPKGSPKQRGSKGEYALPGTVVNLLPTPTASMWKGVQPLTRNSARDNLPTRVHRTESSPAHLWRDYLPAIRRWEQVTDRPAPPAVSLTSRQTYRLCPDFVEWLMGLPARWVTGVPGLSRSRQLQILGNGVVPQQAHAAYVYLLGGDLHSCEKDREWQQGDIQQQLW